MPLLVSRPSSSPCFQVETLPPTLEPAEVLDHLQHLAKAPFALEQGPLFRVHLLTKPADGGRPAEQFLLCSMHHIIVDGRSLLPLITTLLDAYLARVAGEPPTLVPAAASYADFVAWEQEMMTSDEGQGASSPTGSNSWRAPYQFWNCPTLDPVGRRCACSRAEPIRIRSRPS